MNRRRSEEWVSMSRFLVGLAAVLLALPAAVGVPASATPAAASAGYAPVVQVSPADKDDDDGDHHEKKSLTRHTYKQKSKHTEDVDVSGLSDEEVAGLGTALVVAALAAVV